MNKSLVLTGSILLVLGIILGAFGAHGLEKIDVSPDRIASYEVGVRYQFYMAFSLLVLGLAADKFSFSLKAIGILLFFGFLLFSGSIYLLSLQDAMGANLKFLGPITPIGGLLMIVGWLVFIFRLMKR